LAGCADSTSPAPKQPADETTVVDGNQALRYLVVVRSAGEALDHSVIGSLEFGVAELHTPLLMVLGHQRCGAIDATIKARRTVALTLAKLRRSPVIGPLEKSGKLGLAGAYYELDTGQVVVT
jgi:carbonic anhydrase